MSTLGIYGITDKAVLLKAFISLGASGQGYQSGVGPTWHCDRVNSTVLSTQGQQSDNLSLHINLGE